MQSVPSDNSRSTRSGGNNEMPSPAAANTAIVTAMGATTGIFGRPEVALMVAVVLLTTLLTPVALRGAFHLKSPQDLEEGLLVPDPGKERAQPGLKVETRGVL